MKNKIIIFSIALFAVNCFPPFGGTKGGCQNIAINTTGALPDSSAALDIDFTDKGLLIPRIALTSTDDITTIASAATGLLVYNIDTAGVSPDNVLPGFYYWNGTKWISLSGGSGGNDWSLLGNAGTVDGTHFIGTTDNVPFNIRVNNYKAGRIEASVTSANTFFGYQSGNANTSGYYNTASGYQALFSNTTGYYNTAYGLQALYSNINGTSNTAIGVNALFYNTDGNNNTASGYRSLYSNTSGNYNTASGYRSLNSNTTGNYNTASGYRVLYYNTTGSYNTASGYQTLYSNSTGYSNVAMGVTALYSNTNRSNLVAIGDSALYSNSTGIANTAVGSKALYSNTTGPSNSAIGYQALYSNTLGDANTANGFQALYSNITGSSNTASGFMALSSNTGNNNTALGFQAGNNITSGSNNLIIGYDVDAPVATSSNQLSIGNLLFGTGLDGTGTTVSTGNLGVATNAPAYKLDVNGAVRTGRDGTDGQLRIFSEQGATDYEVVFNPNAAMTATTTYTLPAADGVNGNLLRTNGSGALSWGGKALYGFEVGYCGNNNTCYVNYPHWSPFTVLIASPFASPTQIATGAGMENDGSLRITFSGDKTLTGSYAEGVLITTFGNGNCCSLYSYFAGSHSGSGTHQFQIVCSGCAGADAAVVKVIW